MMLDFHWTFEEYQHRPLWIDTIYQLKLKAEAKYQEIKAKDNNVSE
jgi:hypothetical protein